MTTGMPPTRSSPYKNGGKTQKPQAHHFACEALVEWEQAERTKAERRHVDVSPPAAWPS